MLPCVFYSSLFSHVPNVSVTTFVVDLIEEVRDGDTNSHISDLEVVSRTNEYGS